MLPSAPGTTLFPYTTLFRSLKIARIFAPLNRELFLRNSPGQRRRHARAHLVKLLIFELDDHLAGRSEEHTSELQSRPHLVCRLLLEKKKEKSLTSYVVDPHP